METKSPNRILRILKTDSSYWKLVSGYSARSTAEAFGLWVILVIVYIVLGFIYITYGLYLVTEINFIFAAYCYWKVYKDSKAIDTKEQKKIKRKKSVLLGIGSGLILFAVVAALNIFVFKDQMLTGFGTVTSFLYYAAVIALPEEFIFRKYLQPRLYGRISNDFLAVAAGGVLFMGLHIPFQMISEGIGILQFLQNSWLTLLMTFIWHFVFNELYRKYNSAFAPVIFHAIMDWSGNLFI
ncbi:MAG TPA: CPBP family intramembrane metalloprotease [Lachnospiraceae bacterium]|nr:CPBP family intramembrane metalloprotease [Lachnospiraceae bacterium]